MDEPLPILVVEDDPLIGQVIEVTLEEAGYLVVWHELGREAVDAAARLQPCVVLLDLMLPDMDGQDVLRFLRRDPRTRAIPVVVVSAVASTLTDDERGLVQAVLPKPFAIDRLVETVRSVQRTGPAPTPRVPGRGEG
ncbi:MAG TPA: response regulator [Chloroflexota bacterium]|jgi:DNA-binding response OmpR family regulator